MATAKAMAPPHRAIYAYAAQEPDELTLHVGDAVHVQQQQDDGWWFGVVVTDSRPRCGLFPGCYVEKVLSEEAVAGAACRLQARVRGRLARAVEVVTEVSTNATINLIRELESRAVRAEESLKEERRAARAFRDATTSSLGVLETTLAKSLAPLGGVVLEAPRGDATFWEAGGTQRASSRADDFGRAVAEHLSAKIRQGVLGRRVVAWEDFCDALAACQPRRRRKDDDAGKPPRRRKRDLDEAASSLQARVRGHQQRAQTRTPAADDDDRLVRVLARFQKPLREVFRKYRKGRAVTAQDFVRLCREEKISPTLLSHQEVAAVCRATLAEHDVHGLDEANLSRALARVACAAYAAVPTMGVGDKVEALFIHMGLAERLVEAARQARPAPMEHPFAEPGPVRASPDPPSGRRKAPSPAAAAARRAQRRAGASPSPPRGP